MRLKEMPMLKGEIESKIKVLSAQIRDLRAELYELMGQEMLGWSTERIAGHTLCMNKIRDEMKVLETERGALHRNRGDIWDEEFRARACQ